MAYTRGYRSKRLELEKRQQRNIVTMQVDKPITTPKIGLSIPPRMHTMPISQPIIQGGKIPLPVKKNMNKILEKFIALKI